MRDKTQDIALANLVDGFLDSLNSNSDEPIPFKEYSGIVGRNLTSVFGENILYEYADKLLKFCHAHVETDLDLVNSVLDNFRSVKYNKQSKTYHIETPNGEIEV